MDSILTSIKKMLGIVEDYTQFDDDLIMHINSVFTILNQMGVGPKSTYRISSKTDKWIDFLNTNTDIESVKSYIFLKVRLIFDPPINGAVKESINQMINELEWRLSVSILKEDDMNE